MSEKIYLDTSEGTAAYAERFGAEFDRKVRQWYVIGEVPPELLNLLPKPKKKKALAPACPICGSHTAQRTRKSDGHLFWGCSQYARGCKGVIDYDEYLEGQAAVLVAQLIVPDNNVSPPPPSTQSLGTSVSEELVSAVAKVMAIAKEQLGSDKAVEKWLLTPKAVALKGRTPIQAMTSIEGCQAVENLARQINQ